MRSAVLLAAFCFPALLPTAGFAQWQMQNSNSTADLRGIDNVGGGVAWASGTHGTVLRTEDGGYIWQTCAVPPGAEKLDFRGVQAFDANTAIVMSSGPGDLSRLYETTDGCHTWKLVFTNPDKDGFWDGLLYIPEFDLTLILGDPVQGNFRLFSQASETSKFSSNWNGHVIKAAPGEAAFAASNSLIVYNLGDGMFSFITGGSRSEIIHEEHGISHEKGMFSEWSRSSLPFLAGESSGAFSIAAAPVRKDEPAIKHAVIVGGDYRKPEESSHTAAFSSDWGYRWHLSDTPPHGYRSAVAYDSADKLWITVGPNGTDVSADDGKNWRAVHPDAALHEAADADRNWNAISLPFVVGPHGRIGRLEAAAVKRK